eukprot:1844196-Prymnesium_polylepis.1
MTIPKHVWGVAKASQTVIVFARHKSSPPRGLRCVSGCVHVQSAGLGCPFEIGCVSAHGQAIEITEEGAKAPRRRGDL